MTATKPGPELIDPTGTTSGHVLTSTGGSTAPTFQAGGGGWEFVSMQQASASSTIAFTGLEDGYDHKFMATTIDPSADMYLEIVLGTGVTPTWVTANYETQKIVHSSTTVVGERETAAPDMNMNVVSHASNGGAAGEYIYGFEVTLIDPGDGTSLPSVHWTMGADNNGGNFDVLSGWGFNSGATAVTALRFEPSTGTFTSGDFFLYRRANS